MQTQEDVESMVLCRKGDEGCRLAPTHTYVVLEKRNTGAVVELRVANSLGDEVPGWHPFWPHFEWA